MHCLEQAIIATCADFGVSAKTTKCTGVWVDEQKIGSLGEQVTIFLIHTCLSSLLIF